MNHTTAKRQREEFRRFESHIAIEPYKLTQQTREQIEQKLNDIAEYEGAHTDFDIHDPNGEVAAVYLFQKGGKLYARGDRNTRVLRNPANLEQFLQRNKRLHDITLIVKHEGSAQ